MNVLMSHSTEAFLPTTYGPFDIRSFPNLENPYAPAIVLIAGPIETIEIPLIRIHSECLTGDVFGSMRCDCGYQLHKSLKRIAVEGGLIIYLRQEGRGIGLHNKIEAYQKQDMGLDTVEANEALGFKPDLRNYDEAIAILRSFQLQKIRLLTNNPDKVSALESAGIQVIERIPIIAAPNEFNKFYLETKREKMGHLFP